MISTSQSFVAFLPAFNGQSDRHMVLVACRYLDELLRRTLLAFFVDDGKSARLVNGFKAPLKTFATRIRAAAALGLLDPTEAADCELFQKIRNRFSHEVHLSFADLDIASFCGQLILSAKNYGKVGVEPRDQFSSAATPLILRLANRPYYAAGQRLRTKSWPRLRAAARTRHAGRRDWPLVYRGWHASLLVGIVAQMRVLRGSAPGWES